MVEARERSPFVEVPEPETGVQIPEVSPSADERGGGGPSLMATEPELKTSVAQMVAPDRIVVLPEADPSGDEVPDTSSSFDSLEQQLAEFRALFPQNGNEDDSGSEPDTEPQSDRWTDAG